MSQSIGANINPVLVPDRRLKWTEDSNFAVLEGSFQNTFQSIPTDNYSSNQVQFQIQPPSPLVAVNRQMYVRMQFSLVCTGTAGANGHLFNIGTYDAPRSCPIAQITQTLSININNSAVSQNNYQLITALLHCNLDDSRFKTDLSLTPATQDVYQYYNQNYDESLGITNDPLAAFGQGSKSWLPRGGWLIDSLTDPLVVPGAATSATVVFTVTEPLWLSPFSYKDDDLKAFIGIQQFTLTFILGNLPRIWSHNAVNANAGVITTYNATIASKPAILVNYITPPKNMVVPTKVSYQYSSVTVYPTIIGTVLSNATQTFTAPNIQLPYIPRRILVFIRRQDQDLTATTSDVFTGINSINITWDNQTGILASATPQQLYQMSRNSGLEMSFVEWSKYTGGIMVIDVPTTLALQNTSEAPGVSTTKQLTVQVNFTNLNPVENINFTMYVCTIADGLMTIENQNTFLQDAILSPADVERTKEKGEAVEWERSTNFYGGASFLSKALNAAKHVGKAAFNLAKERGILSSALAAHPSTAPLAPVAQAYGYGSSGGRKVSKQHLLGYR